MSSDLHPRNTGAHEEAVNRPDRFRALLAVDLFKWGVGGAVIIAGFLMIKPREQDRLDRELRREVFAGYVQSSDRDNPYLWKRKFELVSALCEPIADHSLGLFLKSEEERIQNAIDAHDAAQSASEALADSQENLEELQEQMASSERSDDEDLENQIAASKRSIQKNRKQLGEAAADLRQYGIRFVPDRRDLRVDGLELGDTR